MADGGQKLGVLANCPINKDNCRELAKHFNLYFAEEVPSRDELLADVGSEIQIVISDGPRHIDAALMDRLPNLGLICMMSVGLDHLDVEAAKARNIQITNAAGTNAPSCADHAFALLLSVSRHILANDRSMRDNEADEECPKFHSTTIYGRRIGILGLGAIGMEIAKRAAAFDMEVFYHNRSERDDVSYTYCSSLLELAREVQILAISCPGGEATKNIVNAEVLEALGPEGTLINIARGSIVDTNALVTALQNGVIKNAGLDVVGGEASERGPLCDLENVVLSPHLSGNTEESWQNRNQLAHKNLLSFLNNEALENLVG